MEDLNAEILSHRKFLIVDNAPQLSGHIKNVLGQIHRCNELNEDSFSHEYVQATNPIYFSKILEYENILVSTTFTTIKSDAFEDLIEAAIANNIKNKNIFSLFQFDIVGESFENYTPEILELRKNNVHFYFISDDLSMFEHYNK